MLHAGCVCIKWTWPPLYSVSQRAELDSSLRVARLLFALLPRNVLAHAMKTRTSHYQLQACTARLTYACQRQWLGALGILSEPGAAPCRRDRPRTRGRPRPSPRARACMLCRRACLQSGRGALAGRRCRLRQGRRSPRYSLCSWRSPPQGVCPTRTCCMRGLNAASKAVLNTYYAPRALCVRTARFNTHV